MSCCELFKKYHLSFIWSRNYSGLTWTKVKLIKPLYLSPYSMHLCCVGHETYRQMRHSYYALYMCVCMSLSGRKRKWFTVEDALQQLSLHKPVQLAYLQSLLTCRNEKVTWIAPGILSVCSLCLSLRSNSMNGHNEMICHKSSANGNWIVCRIILLHSLV